MQDIFFETQCIYYNCNSAMLSHNKVNMNSLAKIVSLKFTIASVIFVSDVENS